MRLPPPAVLIPCGGTNLFVILPPLDRGQILSFVTSLGPNGLRLSSVPDFCSPAYVTYKPTVTFISVTSTFLPRSGRYIATAAELGLMLTRSPLLASAGVFAGPSLRWSMNTVVGLFDALCFQLMSSTVIGRLATALLLPRSSFRFSWGVDGGRLLYYCFERDKSMVGKWGVVFCLSETPLDI